MTHKIGISHRVEMAHRLSHINAPTKCQSIHGHSWLIEVELSSDELDELDMILEFGRLKRLWRHHLDETLDHHLVVRRDDPVALAILAVQPDARITFLDVQPTTESLAKWCHDELERVLKMLDVPPHITITSVHVQETPVNAATYEP